METMLIMPIVDTICWRNEQFVRPLSGRLYILQTKHSKLRNNKSSLTKLYSLLITYNLTYKT